MARKKAAQPKKIWSMKDGHSRVMEFRNLKYRPGRNLIHAMGEKQQQKSANKSTRSGRNGRKS